MMNGGYLMVSKTDTKLYEKLNNALAIGKPILWYEDANTCYYIDTITKSGTDIILTKGGKTITIENDGDITEVGDVSYKVRCYVFNLDNFKYEGVALPYNYVILITDKDLRNKKFSELPNGKYALIGGKSDEISTEQPIGIEKYDDEIELYTRDDNSYTITIDSDTRFQLYE